MLENIHIQNFRCFEDFKAEGFERINLIGGKNNSGKTCLLEGIFFGNSVQQPKVNVVLLRNYRNAQSDGEFYKNIVFQKKIELPIVIETSKDNKIHKITTTFPFDSSEIKFHPGEWEEGKINYHYTFFAFIKNHENEELIINIFDNLSDEKKEKIKLSLQNILSIKIEKLKLEDGLFQLSCNNSIQPIYYFGDALQYILYYLISFYGNDGGWRSKIILFDEIENGIHYTAHYDFWKAIFKLSKELNVQIFATTHSLEMIQQFNKVAKEEGEAAYFEMSRNQENNIIAIKHSADILEEELELNIGVRGEVLKDKISITPELINTLNNAVKNAKEGLVANNIAVPFIKDGWIWETAADGTEKQVEKLEPLKVL